MPGSRLGYDLCLKKEKKCFLKENKSLILLVLSIQVSFNNHNNHASELITTFLTWVGDMGRIEIYLYLEEKYYLIVAFVYSHTILSSFYELLCSLYISFIHVVTIF